MTHKRVKIGYTESSKAVTADVTVEWLEADENFKYDEALLEVQQVFDKAQKYAITQTLRTKV